MSFFQTVRQQQRPPAIGREVVVSPYYGKLRVQRWPRPRGLPTDALARARLGLFALIQRMAKNLQAVESETMRNAIAEHNRRNRGQRGSAAIRLRDWHHMRLTGRGFAFDLPNGLTAYPHGVRRDASHLMDHVTMRPGNIAVRKPEGWRGTTQPVAGAVFRMNNTGDGADFLIS